jgi:hypothetical protein
MRDGIFAHWQLSSAVDVCLRRGFIGDVDLGGDFMRPWAGADRFIHWGRWRLAFPRLDKNKNPNRTSGHNSSLNACVTLSLSFSLVLSFYFSCFLVQSASTLVGSPTCQTPRQGMPMPMPMSIPMPMPIAAAAAALRAGCCLRWVLMTSPRIGEYWMESGCSCGHATAGMGLRHNKHTSFHLPPGMWELHSLVDCNQVDDSGCCPYP